VEECVEDLSLDWIEKFDVFIQVELLKVLIAKG
jgi:hypothetical protein